MKSPGAFRDPALPADYAPFGIQTIGGRIVVTYAKQDADAGARRRSVAGAGGERAVREGHVVGVR